MLQKDSPTPLELTTSQLRYNTRTQVANTDKVVNITQGSLKVRSKGLSFDNSTGILELLKDVNGTYVIKNQ
jgi:LPS export ABC transporter protein LptC